MVIATPADTHFEMARTALLDNKHVFVEKPLALFASKAEELNQLAMHLNIDAIITQNSILNP